MEEREIIAKAVNTYKDEIFSTGITNVRRQQIWKQICAEHNAKCPERIDVLHARRTWNYIRKRALKLADDPSQVDKITNVSLRYHLKAGNFKTKIVVRKIRQLFHEDLLFVDKMLPYSCLFS